MGLTRSQRGQRLMFTVDPVDPVYHAFRRYHRRRAQVHDFHGTTVHPWKAAPGTPLEGEKTAALSYSPGVYINRFRGTGAGIKCQVIGWNLSIIQIFFHLHIVRPCRQWVCTTLSANKRKKIESIIIVVFDWREMDFVGGDKNLPAFEITSNSLLGKFIAPGDKDNIPLWLTIVCGIGGMVIGGYLGQAMSRDDAYKHLTVFDEDTPVELLELLLVQAEYRTGLLDVDRRPGRPRPTTSGSRCAKSCVRPLSTSSRST